MITSIVESSQTQASPSVPDRSKRADSDSVAELTPRVRFLNALYCLPVDRPPIWLMRQAGRSLPEYRKLKEQHSFLELVRTPELAAEATLQPIRRFHFDAAILFSDILVVAEALGQSYRFREQGGIEMAFALRTAEDIDRLEAGAVQERLHYVAKALPIVRQELGDRTALLGFAGSPWTLANFMLEGGSTHDFQRAKTLLYTEPKLLARLLEKLTNAVTDYLLMKVEAGVDAIQIFDSLGGLLAPRAYEAASGRWIRTIIEKLEGRVPVIVFAKGAAGCWDKLVATGAQALSVDWTLPLSEVRARLPKRMSVQGNLDPFLLSTKPDLVKAEAQAILESMRGTCGHIFNLGHGVPADGKLECIEALVQTVRQFK